jgi:hypothetical protein
MKIVSVSNIALIVPVNHLPIINNELRLVVCHGDPYDSVGSYEYKVVYRGFGDIDGVEYALFYNGNLSDNITTDIKHFLKQEENKNISVLGWYVPYWSTFKF